MAQGQRVSAPITADILPVATSAVGRGDTRSDGGVIPSVADNARSSLLPLVDVPLSEWARLQARAIEANPCYLPAWARAVANHARNHRHASALTVFDVTRSARLTGLMPVRWARHALALPVPALVSWNAYAPYGVPLLDRDCASDAADALIAEARRTGARALLLRTIATDGPAYAALSAAFAARGLRPRTMKGFQRAGLDATQDPETALRVALGGKKLKELRRQRHRLEDKGAVTFEMVGAPDRIGAALDAFLALESGGWKGRRGTALVQRAADVAFIREAAPALAASGQFQVAVLTRNGHALAAGLVLRDAGRAHFVKIAMDESEARCSPGVQLTLELTKYLCGDPAIRFADSTADGEHPMIDRIWRARIPISDIFVPLAPRDPLAAAIGSLIATRYRAVDLARTLRRMKETL